MSKAAQRDKPDVVKRAIAEEDRSLLSLLGKKGAVQANDNREARKAQNERIAAQHSTEDEQLKIAANEHIVPIDPEDERNAA